MGSRGDCFDNAVAESFFATLKNELIHGRTWPSKAELRTEVFEYIEVFFNRRRRHSTLGMLSPADYENRTLAPAGTSLAASRLASTTRIKFTAPTPTAIAYQPVSTEAGELRVSTATGQVRSHNWPSPVGMRRPGWAATSSSSS